MDRTNLHPDNLYSTVRECFDTIGEHRKNTKNIKISQSDALMSGVAVFSLKYPSLLNFEEDIRSDTVEGRNIRTLFKIEHPPSDTQMRDIIDPIDPEHLRKPFDNILGELQRANVLQDFQYIDGHYLGAMDGSGLFGSSKHNCDDCIVKKHKNGSKSYHHQLLGVSLIHPDKNTVISLFPEPISNRDGEKKQDCELKSAQRWVEKFRRYHPKMKLILLLDGLYANAPFIKLLKKHNIRFIIGAKPDALKALFSQYAINKKMSLTGKHNIVEEAGEKVKKNVTHEFGFLNGLDLNTANPDVKVNFLEYSETIEYADPGQDKKKVGTKVKKFSWITDIEVDKGFCRKLMRAGRGRWKIENETFRTLKTKTSYNITHSYGHGSENLCTDLGVLAMLAFLIDQAQELGCELFRQALEIEGAKRRLWESFKAYFRGIILDGWKMMYGLITGACRMVTMPKFEWVDTS